MAKIPLPERGQPLDVSYLYQIANAVNEISSQISSTSSNFVTLNTAEVKQSVKTSDAKVVAGYVETATKTTVTAGTSVDFAFPYGTDFKYNPVVTATPQNLGGTPAGSNVSLIIKTITKSMVTGTITYNTTGDVTVGVNIIAVGIPN